MICEICDSEDWEFLRGGWARCNICGRLETVNDTKQCVKCKAELGRYSKKTQKLCLDCLEERYKRASSVPCETKGCCNTLEMNPGQNRMCKQCISENSKEEGLHLWKTKAIEILKTETKRAELDRLMEKAFPSVSKNSIKNWLHKSKQVGTVRSPRFGVHISTGHLLSPPASSPVLIQLTPISTQKPSTT